MSEDFRMKVKEENEKVINELLLENEKLEFFVTGWNMDAIHARAASVGVALFVPIVYAAGYLLSDNVEKTKLQFTNKGIIALNCNKFSQCVSSKKILYSEIKESILFMKNNTLQIITNDDKDFALEFEDYVLDKFSTLIKEKLNYSEEDKKYTSGASKAYKAAIGGSIGVAGVEGASILSDILDNL